MLQAILIDNAFDTNKSFIDIGNWQVHILDATDQPNAVSIWMI